MKTAFFWLLLQKEDWEKFRASWLYTAFCKIAVKPHSPIVKSPLCVPPKAICGLTSGFFPSSFSPVQKKKSHCHIESLFLWLRGIKLLFLPRLSRSSKEKLKGKGSLYCPSLCKVTKGTEKGEWCELLKICYQVAEKDIFFLLFFYFFFSKWDLFS